MHRFCGLGVLVVAVPALAADPWADSVMSYSPGAGVPPGYGAPASALGEPTRFTGVGVFPGAVTPFNPAFLGSEVVGIGAGGHLVVQFDEPVTDDPLNPFGIDLLVFGNSAYEDLNYPNGLAGGLFFGGDGGVIEVSPDGTNWHVVPGVAADGEFPTLGYADLADPYSPTPGSVLTDFTRPVNPALVATGMTFAQIAAAYDGSGGGAGVDIGALGLAAISFVRITPTPGANVLPEIDGFADVTPVPGPAGAVVMLAFVGRRKRTATQQSSKAADRSMEGREGMGA
jgi:hypothetical protein